MRRSERRQTLIDSEVHWRQKDIDKRQAEINALHERCGVATIEMDGTRRRAYGPWRLDEHRPVTVLPTTDGRILCWADEPHVYRTVVEHGREVVVCICCHGYANADLVATA